MFEKHEMVLFLEDYCLLLPLLASTLISPLDFYECINLNTRLADSFG